MPKPNRNQQRRARELQRAEGIPYMTALRRVREDQALGTATETQPAASELGPAQSNVGPDRVTETDRSPGR